MITARLSSLSRRHKRLLQVLLLGGLLAAGASFVTGQSTAPLVDLATEPLYMNGAKAKGNLTLALSVEFPTVGQAYREDAYDDDKTYVGYFDPQVCYVYDNTTTSGVPYFKPRATTPTVTTGDCDGTGFLGNFLNFATASAIDILRYGLTGGNRVIDEGGGSGRTVLERAYLPSEFYNANAYFGQKTATKSQAQKVVPAALANALSSSNSGSGSGSGSALFIYNCKDRVFFGKAADSSGSTDCDKPYNVNADNGNASNLLKANLGIDGTSANGTRNYLEVRALVCDDATYANRLMVNDPATRQWKGLCFRYGTRSNGTRVYKPVGQFQMNARNLRVSVFGYLNDDQNSRYGGVMRSPMKYLGPEAYDANFNLVSGTNPRAEWDAATGVFLDNPQNGDATYGSQGYARSGAINYINKFGTLGSKGNYKTYDPLTELYYEALRYLQGKQPTADAVTPASKITGSASSDDRGLTDNYPVYKTWTDPFSGFQDTSGDAPSCLRNSILTIADVFTHRDWSLPGNTNTQSGDFARGAETSPALNAFAWTKVVGGFESNTSVGYVDSKGRTQNTLGANAGISGNTVYSTLSDLDARGTGSGSSASYAMAGLAYFANTQAFNPTYPKARVRTFTMDVNQSDASNDDTFRRTRQLYLAAKYGGFDDRQADQTGNPYQPGSNILWQGSDGDAQNYFLVSDAAKFLDSLADVFARVVEETGSIAGGAISTTRLASSATASVYQARFNPVADYWSGRLLKFPIQLPADADNLVIGSTPLWEAGAALTARARLDNGANRTIVIGPPKGEQGTTSPAPFTWATLPATHKTAFNTVDGAADTLGSKRVAWLRGDQRDEASAANPTGLFRTRDMVLGDIVNSGIVYVGKPSLTTPGADFRTFFDANRNRASVLYVNANDGMLHAFNDSDGREMFAYLPGFVAPRLTQLMEDDYVHAAMNDATPAIADAKIGANWKTVLVSGVGGGGQGVFALDVTDPGAFGTSKVMWEFTDRDHAAMGNVLAPPQILKLRVEASTNANPTYKYFAVVASGVNNYAADGNAYTSTDPATSGNPSLFFLDLGFTPSTTSPWREGTNFWRIELPQGDTSMAKGLVSFSAVKNVATGAVDTIFAGDLQGNMWKLDFSKFGSSDLATNAATNFARFNIVNGDTPFFVALNASSQRQPITGEPVVVNAFNGQKILGFGTGKFLETSDTNVPLVPAASFYAILDPGTGTVSGRSVLAAGTMNASTGAVTVPGFSWGTGTNQKAGWYFDFDASIAERQISDISSVPGRIVFGSIYPTKGSCGEGGGRLYVLDPLAGNGVSEESQVGVLAAPLVINLGSTSLTVSNTAGRRKATDRLGVITQGAKGMKAASLTSSYTYAVGRMSWRQINNYQANKAAP